MDLLNHDFAHEFPEYASKLRELKQNDAHFQKLFAEYDQLNHEIQRIEGQGSDVADETLEDLKKKRLRLKDEAYRMLQAA